MGGRNNRRLFVHASLGSVEESLKRENQHNKDVDISQLQLGCAKSARFDYTEHLNALHFMIFCACFTGRGLYTIHDFSDQTIWNTSRFHYDNNDEAIKGGGFLRPPKQQLRRLKQLTIENNVTIFPIDLAVFKDAVAYWSIALESDLIELAAVGAKVIYEHRNENTKTCVTLIWFEIENWIIDHAKELRIEVRRFQNGQPMIDQRSGQSMYRAISQIIKDFPTGTWIEANKDQLLDIAWVRNQIAHKGRFPTHQESAAAINLFMEVFNFRTGLNLRADASQAPTFGISVVQ